MTTQRQLTNAPDARDARGEETRRRLLAAGLAIFGSRGFDGVSTRELAQIAGTNQASILYHFGGKKQLYVAVADRIAAHGRAAIGALLESTPSGATKTRDGAVADLSAALQSMVLGLLDLSGDGAAAAFVLREQTQPGPGFETLYDGYIRPVHERVTALVALATGRAARATATIVDAHAVIGMALGFAVSRETLLRRTGWKAYTAEHVEQISGRVAQLAVRALDLAPAPADQVGLRSDGSGPRHRLSTSPQ